MDLKQDAFFFLAIFLFIFVAWVATGGPNKPISFAGPFITPVSTYNDQQEAYGDGNFWDGAVRDADSWFWHPGKSSSTGGDTQQGLWDAQDDLNSLQKDLQQSRLFGTPSVYQNKVTLSAGTAALSQTDEDSEYVTIALSGSARESVTISGWKIVSTRTRSSATIPNGTVLLKSGSLNNTGPITLEPGDRAYVVTGRSPAGISFKENICIGYLEDRQDYTPRLTTSCPAPLSDFDRFYDGAARDYQECRDSVRALPRCETPSSSNGVSSTCYQFMRKYLTYNGCVMYHANDRNFWGSTWRVYLGKSDDLWPLRNDTLKLLDANGYTVDIYSY